MSLSAAKSRVMQARTQIETGRLDDVEPTLAAAPAPPEPAPAPAAEHPADVAPARASRLVEQAWSLVESGRTEAVDAVLAEAAAHLAAVPASPQRDGLLGRAEGALDALGGDWQARMRAQAVHDRWLVLLDGVEDWADESDDPAQRPLEEPRLPKTREAVQRLRHFVRDDDGDEAPAIRAVYRAAAETFERAGVRLDAAFGAMLDDAERRPVPLRGPELDRPLHLATAARYTFEGTRFLEANVARAEALHERWQAEVVAVMTARRALYDRLAAEAGAAWPGIVAGHGPVPFAAGAEPGTTILLSRVHNRAGWDFDGGAHPFSLRHDGVVLAGDYEPHVLAALEHAWYELKLDVNDRIPWDVVAVVEGPGTVGERTVVPVRDLGTGLEIGKREEWPPVPCVRLRIIALHAGPVAV
nr:hypothetical protein GCM10020063_060480 [Dactylosporangium thailandense]